MTEETKSNKGLLSRLKNLFHKRAQTETVRETIEELIEEAIYLVKRIKVIEAARKRGRTKNS